MKKETSRGFWAVSLNLLSIAVLIWAYYAITLPVRTYFYASCTVFFLYPAGSIIPFFSMLTNLLFVVLALLKHDSKKVVVPAFSLSIILLWISFSVYYPWARDKIRSTATESVHWREQALDYISDNFVQLIRDNQGIIPSGDNWRSEISENAPDIHDIISKWEEYYDSSIVMNENIKGMKFDKIDRDTGIVLLFEGPKGSAFGDEKDFLEFCQKNGCSYLLLSDYSAGRFCLKNDSAQSIFGGFNSRDLPLTWHTQNELVNKK